METPDVSGYRGTEALDTSDISGYSSTEQLDIAHVSGYRGTEVFYTPDVSAYSRREMMDTQNVSGYRGTEMLERQCEDTDPRKTTAEGSRHTSDTSQMPLTCGDQTSILKEMFEMMEEMDNKITKKMFEMMKMMDNKITILTDAVNTVLHLLTSCNRAFPGMVIQKQHQEKEENEVLKEKIKKLEARNQELLAKVMAMHPHSEDINDPSRLSAVLERYEMLQLQQWEKVRSSASYRWNYEQGSHVIKKLFDACEKDIQQRTDEMLKCLDIPPSNDAMTKSKQEMMREIRKLFRQLCYKNYPTVYHKIVQEAAILTGTENQTENQFLLQCCHIYCLLLLQDPPVKAEWQINRRYLEHVDKKDAGHWKNPSLLWPIMKRGEEIIVKGVVWDQRRMT